MNIVKSYRDKGKTRHKNIASFGRIDKINKKEIRKLALSLIEFCNGDEKLLDINTAEEKFRKNWGAVRVIKKLWKIFDFPGIFKQLLQESKIKFDIFSTVFLMLVDRLLEPKSKLKTYEEQAKYFGVEEIELQHLYRALDFLADHKEEIEQHIFDKNRDLFNMSVDVVLYDVTTLHFESVHSDILRAFGYSKDCKFNEVQIMLSLIVDLEGRPVGFDIYAGNKFEGHTLEDAIEKMKYKFNINQIILIADQAMLSKANIKTIKDSGYEYIIGARMRNKSEKIKEKILNPDNYIELQVEEEDVFKYKEIKIDGEKLICSWSKKRAKKDKHDRERLIEKAIKKLESGTAKLISKRGAMKYITITTKDEDIELNQEKIEIDEKWDGFYAIQTNSALNSPELLLEYYHQLWRVEESFRIFKSHLETRPMYHSSPNRIKGHIVLCFIAFLLERTLEIELKSNNIPYSPDKIRAALQSLQFSEVIIENQIFYIRAPVEGLANDILRGVKVKIPPKVAIPEHF
ncbi:MAG: IS1634 family transposase [Elusimicrobiota bacterium]